MSSMQESNQVSRWRLILGQSAEPQLAGFSLRDIQLSEEERIMDRALAAIYDNTDGGTDAGGAPSGQRGAGQGKSAPRLAQWLGDVRSFSGRRGVHYPE